MKAKKLIEVAMPIKEISTESVRDKYIHDGHISTLHIWWARRPLALSRAVVFASLIDDPLDLNCSPVFRDAVKHLLASSSYRPYKDIPYTAAYDPVEDNERNRLLCFIGQFSNVIQAQMLRGENVTSKDLLSPSSLIKWENKNNLNIIRLAQKLIWISHNSNSTQGWEELADGFDKAVKRIEDLEDFLYSIPNRHLGGPHVEKVENELRSAIASFQASMPSVFDPFAGGGAIPLEAARLGCRSYGNDINPVAHIVEKASAEFPQKYGKPILLTQDVFDELYGRDGIDLLESHNVTFDNIYYHIPNRLAFDVDYYCRKLLKITEKQIGDYYKPNDKGEKPVVYYWARTVECGNPSCRARIPMLKQFYLSNKKGKQIYLNPIIKGNNIDFSLGYGKCDLPGWNNRGNITCPCCGNITDIDEVKRQSNNGGLKDRLIALVFDRGRGKEYEIAKGNLYYDRKAAEDDIPMDNMQRNSGGGDTFSWGITKWHQLFSERQLDVMLAFNANISNVIPFKGEYADVIRTYLAIFFDRVCSYSSSFGRWIPQNEQLTSLFGRQAIAMNSDYPEINIFSKSTSGAYNQLDWIIRYLYSESSSPFAAVFNNASSGEKSQFNENEITCVVTDPPYYNAIAYADISDFFYLWLKRSIGDIYPLNFSTPQTPKSQECTALKHHHNNNEEEAKKHFEKKLTEIFDAIRYQTSDIVSIMFAHQSTEAWTTLCNSILDARMNITGSWAIDSERDTRMIANAGAALESSVTVACRPSKRQGYGDFKEVKQAISEKVEKEVESLYSLGFRGADLMTACFGQAVSEFGKYKLVEKADGSEVTVPELLDLARTLAFNSLLKGVQGDDFTRFYIGWLQMNGMGETDFDDATKFTRVGMQVDVSEIFARRLLIREGKKQHLATAEEHLGHTNTQGTRPEDSLIDQVHRAMLAYEKGDRHILLTLLHNVGAEDQSAPFWRLAASLKELLPEGKDLKAVEGLLGNSDNLRQDSREVDQHKPEQMTFDFGNDFNNDFK